MRRLALLLLLALCALGAKGGDPTPADDAPARAQRVSLGDVGYFLSKLSEFEKGNALNVLSDLASDSRLDPEAVNRVLQRLLDEASPPPDYGYGCATCFQKRLSVLLEPLRLQGPEVPGPQRGFVVLPLDDRLLRKLTKEGKEALGDSVPDFVRSLMDGKDPSGSWAHWAYPRYHGRGAEVTSEPLFFGSVEALAKKEESMREPLDAWSLAKDQCISPPRNRYDPGFLILEFDVTSACTQVRIPTAADSEDHSFRPTPASETESGRTCGGAPQWGCPNFPMKAFDRVRFVPNEAYVSSMR